MKMNRRLFLRTAAVTGLAIFLCPSLTGLHAAEPDKLPGGLFDSPDPAVLKLADDVWVG